MSGGLPGRQQMLQKDDFEKLRVGRRGVTVISGRAYGDCCGRLCGVAVLRGVAAVARKRCLELLRPQCEWCSGKENGSSPRE